MNNYDIEYYFDKILMLLLMLCFTIACPFLYIGFILKWAYIESKESSKFFITRIKHLYITVYKDFIK